MNVKSRIAFFIFVILTFLPVMASVANGDFLMETPEPNPVKPEGKCVEDTSYMRANHMRELKLAKFNFYLTGVKSEEFSLRKCFTCHEAKSTFCDRCHDYAGVKPRCASADGGCHFGIPGMQK
jgi:hypothetical protein